MTNLTKQQCIHRAGCPKPKVCSEVGHCTSMTESDLQVATPGATPGTEDSIRETAESSRPRELLTSNLKSMRERMLRDEERSEQAFEELSQLIALEAHEDRLKLWEDNERLRAALEVISNQTNSTAEVSTLATTARRALSGDSFTPETTDRIVCMTCLAQASGHKWSTPTKLWCNRADCPGSSAQETSPPRITFPEDMPMSERIGDPRIDGKPEKASDEEAKRLYNASLGDQHNLHILAWSELNEAERNEWRRRSQNGRIDE